MLALGSTILGKSISKLGWKSFMVIGSDEFFDISRLLLRAGAHLALGAYEAFGDQGAHGVHPGFPEGP